MAPSVQWAAILAMLMPASIVVAQTNLGELLDVGGIRLSALDFRQELVGRPMAGPTPTGQSIEVIYLANGELRGAGTATLLAGATGGAQTFDIEGRWTIDGRDRVCTSMQLGRWATLPPRCQYWYRYGEAYFFSDFDDDRSSRVLRRTISR
jgi:hypothetical protein